jgi:hypothetical protein
MTMAVIIAADAARADREGVTEDNLQAIGFDGPERCPHLVGDVAGRYSCAVHDRWWYPETPCYQHTQIETHPDAVCRMGEFLLARGARCSKR